VLLASTEENKAERDADVNLSLPGDGFDAVVKAKEAVEKACPGIVSCADLLAIATRDLVGLVNHLSGLGVKGTVYQTGTPSIKALLKSVGNGSIEVHCLQLFNKLSLA